MYAIIETGGKQYKVEQGQIINVEKLDVQQGEEINFDKVLLIKNEENIITGSPVIEKAKVVGEVIETGKGKKIIVFKYKRRKNYRRKKGHRQWYSKVKIKEITLEE